MSERKMRIEYYKMAWVEEMTLDAFVRQRFEVGLWSAVGDNTRVYL